MIGIMGELHPKFAKENGVSGTVAFELDMNLITKEVDNFSYKILNKFYHRNQTALSYNSPHFFYIISYFTSEIYNYHNNFTFLFFCF